MYFCEQCVCVCIHTYVHMFMLTITNKCNGLSTWRPKTRSFLKYKQNSLIYKTTYLRPIEIASITECFVHLSRQINAYIYIHRYACLDNWTLGYWGSFFSYQCKFSFFSSLYNQTNCPNNQTFCLVIKAKQFTSITECFVRLSKQFFSYQGSWSKLNLTR